ncbi:hypothetical protein POL68_33815 [Stigmatella sp. ncwal1]|uniref:Lipoprotein n=1 Tax=Stigmatella ashevillensis TaxID=2995309 RepID=A0ABT5DMA3_9BACT|nr:hypothetical protein [Stigmatella ashevillena]MDC0713491.1 hypothetical protein [Stigmatella ashevillena]
MKNVVSVVLLAAGFLVACGTEAEVASGASAAAPSEHVESAPPAVTGAPGAAASEVSAQSCVQLYRPRYMTWWTGFPIQVDGEVGACETYDDCSTSCWGQESPYPTYSSFFYCTVCN